jgi:hypothetical protein
MDMRSIIAATLLPGLAAPLLAYGQVTVQFVRPETYIDSGNYGYDSARNLADLEKYMQSVGTSCLKAGENLELRVLNIDLAGRYEWWHGPAYGPRIMREITWPRKEITYSWHDAAGQPIAQGQEWLSDMNYLARSSYVRGNLTSLPYEKAMLKDWFQRRFCDKATLK